MFGSLIDMALSPVEDVIEFTADLTQGKVNTGAATRIATDVALGYALAELLDSLDDD